MPFDQRLGAGIPKSILYFALGNRAASTPWKNHGYRWTSDDREVENEDIMGDVHCTLFFFCPSLIVLFFAMIPMTLYLFSDLRKVYLTIMSGHDRAVVASKHAVGFNLANRFAECHEHFMLVLRRGKGDAPIKRRTPFFF